MARDDLEIVLENTLRLSCRSSAADNGVDVELLVGQGDGQGSQDLIAVLSHGEGLWMSLVLWRESTSMRFFPLMVMLPTPFRMYTRATESLRL